MITSAGIVLMLTAFMLWLIAPTNPSPSTRWVIVLLGFAGMILLATSFIILSIKYMP